MHRANKRIGALALAAVAAAALALGGVAYAAGGTWWQSEGNTLTVQATGNADLQADIATADVVVDVVKIADAAPNAVYEAFDYTLTGDFAGLTLAADPIADDWQALAEAAADRAQLTAAGTAAVDQPIEGLSDGLYLVLAHGAGNADDLTALSDLYRYEFAPTVVALPSKDADENGVIRTDADYGDWHDVVAVTLKPERQPLYGSLRIDKTVQDFAGEPATFVFHLAGTTPDGEAYDNYAAVTVTGGSGASTTVTHIPAGTVLTVSEDYSGARYQLVSGDSSPKTIVSDAAVQAGADMASAAFVNQSNGSGKGGHGIQNNFELSSTGEGATDWDWTWTATPGQSDAA